MYRRNQVEAAIARSTWQVTGPDQEPSLSLRNDLKRLIDTDRILPGDEGATKPDHQRAFMTGEGVGKGGEQDFTKLDTLLLSVALNLSRAGLTQRRAVRRARSLRRWLGREVDGRLGAITSETLSAYGQMELERRIESIESPIVEAYKRLHMALSLNGREDLFVGRDGSLVNLFAGTANMADVLGELGLSAYPVLVMDIGSAFVRLVYWLDRIQPVKRGRKA